jgi:predicted Zn-dependent peptidase
MSRAAKSALLGAEPADIDDLIRRVDSVSVSQVRALADELLGAEPALALVGPDRRGT